MNNPAYVLHIPIPGPPFMFAIAALFIVLGLLALRVAR